MLHYDKVKIITVAKVGSANFLNCNYLQTKNVHHGHSLLNLRNTLNEESNCLIIVGIRNPIDRNLSHLFQSFNDKNYNNIQTKKNNYKGEYCYIPNISHDDSPTWMDSNIKITASSEKIIDLYFKQNYHNTFNEWFEEFLEITKINNFDKDKGIDFYSFPNDNTIMIYTMEKLSENEKCILDTLGITNLSNINNSEKRGYNEIYKEVKKMIVYEKEYLNNLLHTKIMNLFYSDLDIENFYNKYRIV